MAMGPPASKKAAHHNFHGTVDCPPASYIGTNCHTGKAPRDTLAQPKASEPRLHGRHHVIYPATPLCLGLRCMTGGPGRPGSKPVQFAHAGTASVWYRHSAALDPHQRVSHLPAHRRRGGAAVDALVRQQRRAEHRCVPAPAGVQAQCLIGFLLFQRVRSSHVDVAELGIWLPNLHGVLVMQGGLDHRVSGAIITASECAALLAAFVIVLSMLGVNVNALLLPAGVALAFAAKDLSHNFLAGVTLHWVGGCDFVWTRMMVQKVLPATDCKFALCRVLLVCCAAIQTGRQGGCQLLNTVSREQDSLV